MRLEEIKNDNWIWATLDELSSTPNFYSSKEREDYLGGLFLVKTEVPKLPEGTIGMLFARKRIFIDKSRILGLEGVPIVAGAPIMDAAITHSPSFGLAVALLQLANLVNFLSPDEQEFLNVLLYHVGQSNDPYTTPTAVKTVATSYAIPEEYDDGTRRVESLASQLAKRGVVEYNRETSLITLRR